MYLQAILDLLDSAGFTIVALQLVLVVVFMVGLYRFIRWTKQQDQKIDLLNAKMDRYRDESKSEIKEQGLLLNGRIDQLETKMDGRIDQLETKMDGRIAQLGTKMDGHVGELRTPSASQEEYIRLLLSRFFVNDFNSYLPAVPAASKPKDLDQGNSPLTLTEKGERVARNTNLAAIVARLYPQFKAHLLWSTQDTAYDIQQRLGIYFVSHNLDRYLSAAEIKAIKDAAFLENCAPEAIYFTMGLIFRDKLLAEYDLMPECFVGEQAEKPAQAPAQPPLNN